MVGGADRFEVVLHDDHGVAVVLEPLEQVQQTAHIARVQADAGLVEHVERIHEVGAEGIRERDALGLAAGERTRRAVEGEVAESDVHEEARAGARFAQDVRRDLLLERRQLEVGEPRVELFDRERAHLRNVLAGHAHVERRRLQPRAVTIPADARELVLPQEDADILLVLLGLEVLEERDDALVAARLRVEELAVLIGGELAPRRIKGDALLLRERGERGAAAVVARFGPRVDRAIAERALGVRHDELLVVLERGAEAVAGGAGAARIIEGEKLGRGSGGFSVTFGAFEVGGERKTDTGCRLSAVACNYEGHSIAVAFGEGGAEGVGEAAGRVGQRGGVGWDLEAIDDDQQLLRGGEIVGIREFVEMFERAVLQYPHEALRAEAFDDLRVRHLFAQSQRERDREPCPGVERKQAIGDGLDAVGSQLAAAHGAMRVARTRPEQPQEIVDLGGGAHGGPRRARGVLLLDRDGGREAVNEIDVGLLHALEELARIRRKRLDVAPLPLGVDRVERERTLARAGGSRDHRDGAPGDVEVDSPEVVLPRATDDQMGLHAST